MIESYIKRNEDPRIQNYFMMQSPAPVFMITLIYLFFVKVLGKKIMENRKAFELKNILLLYNLFQVIFNGFIFSQFANVWINNYNWRCESLNRNTTPREMLILSASYLFFISKFPEMLDTVFFILRKKNDQVSMLHVIHHSVMPFICWFGAKCFPGGDNDKFSLTQRNSILII